MTRWIKQIFMVWLLAGLIGGVVYAFLPRPLAVDIAVAARGPLLVTVDEDGKTKIRERYVVSAPVAGRLLRITLRPGDTVSSRHMVVATIEPSLPELLDSRAIAQTEARVKGAEAAVSQSVPNLEKAVAAFEFAESENERARQLRERNSISPQEFEEKKMLERTRREELRAAKFASEIAHYELEQARAALLRTRPVADGTMRSEQFDVPAPICGRVLHVFEESAAVVAAGASLIELGDPTDLEVEIDVLSSDAVRIRPGARVILEQWGGGYPLEARVRLIEPAAFTKTSALGVEEQRVNVIADFVTPLAERGALGDGFRVEARIVVTEKTDVLKIPTSAMFRRDGAWAAFVLQGGRAELRLLRVGARNAVEAEILEGLTEAEQVIVYPSDKVQPGAAIHAR